MLQNNFRRWYSKETKFDNQEAILLFEQTNNIKFPDAYKELVRFHDGGILEKDIFSYDNGYEIETNCVGFFLPWQKETLELEGEYILDQINNPPEFFPQGLIPFAPDGGGNYLCFDYRNCKENPPIIFWHHAVEENEGVFLLADSFEQFIDSLKSEEEMEKVDKSLL